MNADFSIDPELGQEVPVASIDKALRQLWQENDGRANASLINLVTCSEKSGSLRENSAILRELTREHACRAILVEFDRQVQEPSIRAWVTAHCHLAEGKKSVCCEQISFLFTGRVTGRFRNTVFSQLNSDLPLVFWWQGELTDVFRERLSSVIDRLVIDSTEWTDPRASHQRLHAAVEESTQNLVVQDLAWTRTWQFRLSLAGIFDQPTALDALPKLERGRIGFHPDHRNSALQLLAWLSVQSGWALDVTAKQEAGVYTFSRRAGGPVVVELQADEASAPIGVVELSAPEVVVRLTRAAGGSHVTRELIAGGMTLSSLGPADPDDPGGLVGAQLSRGGKNTLYRKILPRFLELLSC